MAGMFDIYDCIEHNLGEGIVISTLKGKAWNMVETDCGAGLAMYTEGNSIKPLLSRGLYGMHSEEFAPAIESWNFEEAGMALAGVNAIMNNEKAAARYNCASGRYTDDLNLSGKTVGMVGHFRSAEKLRQEVGELYILERDPQEGDWPDSACDWLLPKCDVVFISGSTIINKTLPHLLTLCENAYTVLTGPSVPLCRELFDFNIDRLAGMIVTDVAGMREHVVDSKGSPVPFGKQFVLTR